LFPPTYLAPTIVWEVGFEPTDYLSSKDSEFSLCIVPRNKKALHNSM